jgi:N-acyl-phosphatidylethanolamine-hydrolysing phospholipase D
VGHATFLIQAPGLNLLTDPVFGRRASPVRWAGPPRFSPPGIALDALPPVDAVLLSHDHYDHLDAPTVERLHTGAGRDLIWFTPLGYAGWFGRRGVDRVVELDWWQSVGLTRPGGRARLRLLPARHWTRRHFWDTRKRLWGSWSLETGDRRLYFGGDSGYCPGFAEIGERTAPFDVALLPIGAYEPRWFMRTSHMNPEEAARASVDLRARHTVAMHWGTFRLTDEDPLEPPARARRAWASLGPAAGSLHVPAIGETLCF